MKKALVIAAVGIAVVGLSAIGASAQINPKKGLRGTHCFFADAAIVKDTLIELRCKGLGQGASYCAGQAHRADGNAPDRVMSMTGTLWADQSSGDPRILANLSGTLSPTGSLPDTLAFTGKNFVSQIQVRLDPATGDGVFESIDAIGAYDPTPGLDGLPDINPATCAAPSTCNGDLLQQNNAGTITYLGKTECPDVPFVLP